MFNAKQPIKSFPMKGSNYADRRHKANIPYHPMPARLPPLNAAPRLEGEGSQGKLGGDAPHPQGWLVPQELSLDAALRAEASHGILHQEPSSSSRPALEASRSNPYSPGQHYEPMSPSNKVCGQCRGEELGVGVGCRCRCAVWVKVGGEYRIGTQGLGF